MAIATCTIVGNMTRDPELKFTASGVAMATFGVAVNARKRDDAGNWIDGDPSFYDVTCWRNLAENVCESLTKGTTIIVVGKLRQRSWETDDGSKRSKVEINAEHVGPALNYATAEVHRAARQDSHTDLKPGEEPF